jgi:hypothetical protein
LQVHCGNERTPSDEDGVVRNLVNLAHEAGANFGVNLEKTDLEMIEVKFWRHLNEEEDEYLNFGAI